MYTVIIDTSIKKSTLSFVDQFGYIAKTIVFETNNMNIVYNEICSFSALISSIVLGIGPGSYTGIRIGATIAVFIGYLKGINIKVVSSLKGMLPSCFNFFENQMFASVSSARGAGFFVLVGKYINGQIIWSSPVVMSLESLSDLKLDQIFSCEHINANCAKIRLVDIDPLSLLKFSSEDKKEFSHENLYDNIDIDYLGGAKSSIFHDGYLTY